MQKIETIFIIFVDVLVDAGQLFNEILDSPMVWDERVSESRLNMRQLMCRLYDTHLRSPSFIHATMQSAIL